MADPEKAEKHLLFSAAAAARMVELIKSDQVKDLMIRIGIRGGGCNGYTNILVYEVPEKVDEENDVLIDLKDDSGSPVTVVVDQKSYEIFKSGNTLVDFKKHGLVKTFTFENEYTKKTCSCGESFKIDQ